MRAAITYCSAVALLAAACLPLQAEEWTEQDRQALASYERQERAFQRVAIRVLAQHVRDLSALLNDVRRDRNYSSSERARVVAELEEAIAGAREDLQSLRDGDVVVPPELDLGDLEVGDYGTVSLDEENITRYSVRKQRTASRTWYAFRGEDRLKVELHPRNEHDELFIGDPIDLIFEVVHRRVDANGTAICTLRIVDIEKLRERQAEQE
ncbi:MAG: hypothetical protein AAGI37_19485 [Planctomycetota bacterium]